MTWAQNETPRRTKERKSGGRDGDGDGDEERRGGGAKRGSGHGRGRWGEKGEQNKLETFMGEMWKCSLVSSSAAPWWITIKTCNSRYRRVDTWPDISEYFIRFIEVFVIIVMRMRIIVIQIRVYSHAGSVAQELLAWNLVQPFMVNPTDFDYPLDVVVVFFFFFISTDGIWGSW